jgi:hypothetical protein
VNVDVSTTKTTQEWKNKPASREFFLLATLNILGLWWTLVSRAAVTMTHTAHTMSMRLKLFQVTEAAGMNKFIGTSKLT